MREVYVSVPLRGLIMWKHWQCNTATNRTVTKVSVPLRGLIMWKLNAQGLVNISYISCFSPLTGINYVETYCCKCLICTYASKVSVPLRGLIMWKLYQSMSSPPLLPVSVPLRGLIMWKLQGCHSCLLQKHYVSVPLRGLIMWKLLLERYSN